MSPRVTNTHIKTTNYVKQASYSQLVWAEIDLRALDSNVMHLKQLASGSDLIMVIKANAYGHGITEIAEHLDNNTNVAAFAVARLDEALLLRKHGIQKRILVLSGCINLCDFQLCTENNLEAVIHNQYSAEIWIKLLQQHLKNPNTPICKAWIKINTGMNRLGLNEQDFLRISKQLKKALQSNGIQTSNLIQGMLSHFSSSEDVSNEKNTSQKKLFASLIKLSELHTYFPTALLCLSNSAGIIYHSDSHLCAVRTGIGAYGLPPGESDTYTQKLKPVMRFKSIIIAIQILQKGESVGYNDLFVAQRETKLATIAVGYGDGYPRNAPENAQVYICGEKLPIAGRVSMDLISVDITNTNASINDEVELWGEHITCNELAKLCDTISYELITRVSQRVPRIYLR